MSDDDLFATLVARAQFRRDGLRGMPSSGMQAAPKLYAACVDFCQKAELPFSSIRVSVFAWGDRAHHKNRTGLSTALRFVKGTWWAELVPRTSGANVNYATGVGELWLDSRPDKKLRAVKRKNEEIYRVQVATWRGQRDGVPGDARETFGTFDPWADEVANQSGKRVVISPVNPARTAITITRLVEMSEVLAGPVELYLDEGSTGWFAKISEGDVLSINRFDFIGTISAQLTGRGEATLSVVENSARNGEERRSVRVFGA